MQNEPAEAMASRLLKAFFEVPSREKAQSVELRAKAHDADSLPKDTRSGMQVPPAP